MKKIIFFGGNSWGIHVIKYLLDKGCKIPVVVTPSDMSEEKVKDIRKLLPYTSIFKGLEIDGQTLLWLMDSQDQYLIIACSYTDIIPKSIVDLKVINIHGAILPYHRGCNMLNWAIIKGWEYTGVTLHYMEETLDTGDIIGDIEYSIDWLDDVNDVKKKMFDNTTYILDRNLKNLMNGTVDTYKQQHALARYYPKRKPEDGRIDWSKNAVDIYNLVRALVRPYPGAFFYYSKEKVIIGKAKVKIDNRPHFNPGKVVKIDEEGITVTAGYNLLLIESISPLTFTDLLSILKIGDYFE